MRWTIPNLLTVARLLAAPGVLLVLVLLPRPVGDWLALVLFIGASVTDWFDGYFARAWRQQTKLGTMLDPIADKAMVVVALAALVGLNGLSFWIAVPVAVILFREVFVSGLREYLGDTAGTLKVTRLAKWKTASQMVAIAVLLLFGALAASVEVRTFGMDAAMLDAVREGREPDLFGLRWKTAAASVCQPLGLGLLWLAAVLTLVTGWDYFTKALPHLTEDEA